jgi:hypothetical protein
MKLAWIPMADNDSTGYGKVGRRLLKAVEDAGAQIAGFRDLDWDLRVAVGGPRGWLLDPHVAKADDLVLHTMFEAWPAPPDWAPVLNRCAAVWTPAQWNVSMFRNSGVTTPIFVSGYGVDPDEFGPQWPRPNGSLPYTFLWAGGSLSDGKNMGDRKGGDLVLAAFRKLNLPDARLILKASGRSAIGELKGDSRITLIAEDVDVTRYAALLAYADCFVYPSHGEGFGLQPLEALAMGVPVIAPAVTGLSEFIGPEVALVLPTHGLEPAWQFAQLYEYECVWPVLSVDDVADRMHWCYTHREEAARLGRRAAEYVMREWTWQQAGVRALDVLTQIRGNGGSL